MDFHVPLILSSDRGSCSLGGARGCEMMQGKDRWVQFPKRSGIECVWTTAWQGIDHCIGYSSHGHWRTKCKEQQSLLRVSMSFVGYSYSFFTFCKVAVWLCAAWGGVSWRNILLWCVAWRLGRCCLCCHSLSHQFLQEKNDEFLRRRIEIASRLACKEGTLSSKVYA